MLHKSTLQNLANRTEQRFEAVGNVRRERARLMQIFCNAGYPKARGKRYRLRMHLDVYIAKNDDIDAATRRESISIQEIYLLDVTGAFDAMAN